MHSLEIMNKQISYWLGKDKNEEDQITNGTKMTFVCDVCPSKQPIKDGKAVEELKAGPITDCATENTSRFNWLSNFTSKQFNKDNKVVEELKSCATSLFCNTSSKILSLVDKSPIAEIYYKLEEGFKKARKPLRERAIPPWFGYVNEGELKEDCLRLSADKANFLRTPPVGVDFQFDYERSLPIAVAVMEHDPNLAKMRYNLVPLRINEEDFWRNYFYRISLIFRVNDLSIKQDEDFNMMQY